MKVPWGHLKVFLYWTGGRNYTDDSGNEEKYLRGYVS